MQGIFFEPSGYFDDKLKRRGRKKQVLSNSKRQLHISSSARSTPSTRSSKSVTSTMYQSHSCITSPSTTSSRSMPDHVFEAYKKRLKRKKANRSRSMNSNGVETLLSIEKKRITKDKLSRLFHDFESFNDERDELFRNKLAILNENKQKNKAIAYDLINEYFSSILDRKYSFHPLALLITKFCNLFHGQYSFSPEDFKHKSIYNKTKRSTTDVFDKKNENKVIRKTSKRLHRATIDVKNFVKKLRSLILSLYPELVVLRTYKYVVQSVFHKELFSQLIPTLNDLYSIKTEDKQCEFAKYMGISQNLSCADFGVSSHFILTINDEEQKAFEEYDANYAISQLLNDGNDILHCEYVNEYIATENNDDVIKNITAQMLSRSHAEMIANQLHNIKNENTKTENNDDPYLTAVLEIKKMPQFFTPEDKIQCVVRTADIIRECIDKYYCNRRVEVIQITPDDLLSLFAYILTKANLHCLWAEVELIDDFVVDNLRMDLPGYYIATLRAAMQLIVNDIVLNKMKTSLQLKSTKL